MVQSAKPRHRDNFAVGMRSLGCHTACRCLLAQSEMRPVGMVIADVIFHQALEMPFIQNNHMIEQIPTAVADPAFGDAILPWTPKAGSLGLNA